MKSALFESIPQKTSQTTSSALPSNSPDFPSNSGLTILKPRLGDGDDLEHGHPSLVQHLVDHLEVRLDVFLADGFEHLDRDETVERVFPRFRDATSVKDSGLARQARTFDRSHRPSAPPEIHQMHRDAILQPGLPNPLLCQDLLLRTQRQRIHRTPRHPHGLDGHAPPPTPDLDDPMSPLDLGFPDDMVQLGVLGRLERVGRLMGRGGGVRVGQVDRVERGRRGGESEVPVERGEDGARVGHLRARRAGKSIVTSGTTRKFNRPGTHIRAQKGRKHPITDIIMRPDIPNRVPDRIHHRGIRGIIPDRLENGSG